MTFYLTPSGSADPTPPTRPRVVGTLADIDTGEPTAVCVVEFRPAARRYEPIAVYPYDDGDRIVARLITCRPALSWSARMGRRMFPHAQPPKRIRRSQHVSISFDKQRAEQVITSIQDWQSIPAPADWHWSIHELLALAGACYFIAMNHGPVAGNVVGLDITKLPDEQRERESTRCFRTTPRHAAVWPDVRRSSANAC